jgi:para-aminobenzoate synthetase
MNPDPVELFGELAASAPRMFWLDGGGSREWSGRRSILGHLRADDVSLTLDAARHTVTRHQRGREETVGTDIFDVLAEHLRADAGDPRVHWVGYLGYACRTDLPAATTVAVPDAVWMRVEDPLFVTHDAPADPSPSPRHAVQTPKSVTGQRERYDEAFAQVQQELHRGNSYEVNLTYREELASHVDPVTAYLRLRAANPAPFAGYLQHHGTHLLSSSPERFATLGADGSIETKPIKGTTRRAADPAEDEDQRRRLAEDPKFRAENLMIVDLLRNDLSMVCEPGSVVVPSLMAVESYATVHQLVSTVRGRLRPGVGSIEALRTLFPAGSMTGAPKLRTMEIIERVESGPRGAYAGAFGWIGTDGRADLGVVIRSLVAHADGDGWRYIWGTGGAITVRSYLDEEWAETRWKAERLRSVLGG